MHAESGEVVAEDAPELVVSDLPDEGDLAPHRGDPRHRVRGRTARMFFGDAHRVIEDIRSVGGQELHRTARQAVLVEELLACRRDDVHHRIAHRHHIEPRFAHKRRSLKRALRDVNEKPWLCAKSRYPLRA